jgi:hypothetical protein
LHGGGESGDGSPEDLEKLKSWGPPRIVESEHDLCFTVDGKQECFIVISPQLLTDFDWSPYYINLVVEHVLNGPENYRVDPNRIYLTGLSYGGYAVYLYAASYENNPNKLAAIAPIAAWGDQFTIGCAISEKQIPVWSFHGALDTVVPYAQGLNVFNRIKNCEDPEPVSELIFTTYADRYHDSWIPAYDPFHNYQDPNLYEWLLRQRRVTTTVEEPTSLATAESGHFSLYPNPASDFIWIEWKGNDDFPVKIKMFDTLGRIKFETDEKLDRLDVSGFSSGIYLLKIVAESEISVKRFFIF